MRSTHAGLSQLALPPRAVYSNDDSREAPRRAEYEALEARCAVEAAERRGGGGDGDGGGGGGGGDGDGGGGEATVTGVVDAQMTQPP